MEGMINWLVTLMVSSHLYFNYFSFSFLLAGILLLISFPLIVTFSLSYTHTCSPFSLSIN